jgi:hypothetical protein
MMPREQPFSTASTSLSFLALGGLLFLPFLPPDSAFDQVGPPGKGITHETPQQPRQDTNPHSGVRRAERGLAQDREQCMHLLKSVAAEVTLLPPIKEDECGTTALVELKSVGSKSPTIFDPPVNVNCRMVSALHRWHRTTLQPASRRMLRSSVARIIGASGYACRRVYNLAEGNLSQHAFGNAIDVSAFVLKDGRIITVRKDWGASRRQSKTNPRKTPAHIRTVSHAGPINNPPIRAGATHSGRFGFVQTDPNAERDSGTQNPARLKRKPDNSVPKATPTSAARFLKRLHRGACGQFQTVLGPEANEVHRSHFHFDLNPSRSRPYCN